MLKSALSKPLQLKFAGIFLVSSVSYLCLKQDSAQTIQNDTKMVTSSIIHFDELSKHNRTDDCWVSIHGNVYDLTNFLEMHPGGVDKLLRFAGKDATRSFKLQHPETHLEKFLAPEHFKGKLLHTEKVEKRHAKVASEKALTGDDLYYKELVKKYLKKEKNRQKGLVLV